MSKSSKPYRCTKCGTVSDKWMGSCPNCSSWNTLEEMSDFEVRTAASSERKGRGKASGAGAPGGGARRGGEQARPQAVNDIAVTPHPRVRTTIDEFDRVLGGGICPGMIILIGGEPGIGKSTLLMQLAGVMAGRTASASDAENPAPIASGTTLYVSTEENAAQLKLRARRLGYADSNFQILCTMDLATVIAGVVASKPAFLMIDSIQMMRSTDSDTPGGSNAQLRLCCQELIDVCHGYGITLFLVAHVTKEGVIAGPKLIEHLVDTVLYFEEEFDEVRYLRGTKNRFGALNEIGIFEIGETGLTAITDPHNLFITDTGTAAPRHPGVATAAVREGSRVLMVEVQALTTRAGSGFSRVYSDRIDPRSISRIAAVLERHAGISLYDQDIYINIAGGIRIRDVGIELAIAHAIFSAKEKTPLPRTLVSIGEISLSGEIKAVKQLERRIKGAADLGYTTCVGPAHAPKSEDSGPQQQKRTAASWHHCQTVAASIDYIRSISSGSSKKNT